MNPNKTTTDKTIKSLIDLFETFNRDISANQRNQALVVKRNATKSRRLSNPLDVAPESELLAYSSRSGELTPTLSQKPKLVNIKATRAAHAKETFEKFFSRGETQRNGSLSREEKCSEPRKLENLKLGKVSKERSLFQKFRAGEPLRQTSSSQLEDLKLENHQLKVAIDQLKKELKAAEKRATKANVSKLNLEQRLKATKTRAQTVNEPIARDGKQLLTLTHLLLKEVHALYTANCKIYNMSSPWLKQEILATSGHVRHFCKTRPNGTLSAIDSFQLHCEMNMKLNKGELALGEPEFQNKDLEGEWEGIIRTRMEQFKVRLTYLLCKSVEHQSIS